MPLIPKQQPTYYQTTRPIKKYTATLDQDATSAPIATVMENTFPGPIIWTRSAMGIYIGTLAGAFTLNKTFILYGKGQNSGYLITAAPDTINTIYISTRDLTTENDEDSWMLQTPIQITVYS